MVSPGPDKVRLSGDKSHEKAGEYGLTLKLNYHPKQSAPMSHEAFRKPRTSVSPSLPTDRPAPTARPGPSARRGSVRSQHQFERELQQQVNAHTRDLKDPTPLRRYPLPIILASLYRVHEDMQVRQLPAIEKEARHLLEQYPHEAEFALLPAYIDYLHAQIRFHIQEQEHHLFPYVSYLQDAHRYGEYYARRVHPVRGSDNLKPRLDDEPGSLSHSTELLFGSLLARRPSLVDEIGFQLLGFRLDELFKAYDLHLSLEQEVLYPKIKEIKAALEARPHEDYFAA